MPRKFGIELEVTGGDHNMRQVAALITQTGVPCSVEGYNHLTRRHWKIVSDASLSGRNMMEIVSPPLKGRAGLAQLEKVAGVLTSNEITVNNSCGLHVHVDASGLTVRHLKNAAKLIAIHEDHMKAILPQSRRVTRWAQWPSDLCIGDTIADRCARIDATRTVGELLSLWGRDRYRAINFESLARHNTIEFRSHSGTCDAKKIMAWVMLCTGIVRNCERDEDMGPKLPCGSKRQFTNLVRYAGKNHTGYFFERRKQFADNPAAVA